MEREQIIKVLEWCTSGGNCMDCEEDKNTPNLSQTGCMAMQMRKALALIKELTEENEGLEDNLIKQCAENIMLLIEQQEIKANAVRKMQEMLKAELNEHYSLYFRCLSYELIDRITKVVLENNNV